MRASSAPPRTVSTCVSGMAPSATVTREDELKRTGGMVRAMVRGQQMSCAVHPWRLTRSLLEQLSILAPLFVFAEANGFLL